MVLMGQDANLLSVGAVDFGIIVDSAVILVENIFRNFQARPEARQSLLQQLSEGRFGTDPTRSVEGGWTEAGADPVAIDAGRLFAGRRRRCSGGACACGECGRSRAGQKRTPRHDRHWFPAVIGRIGAGDSQSDIARSYGVAHIAIGRLTHAPHSEDHAAAAASPHTKSR